MKKVAATLFGALISVVIVIGVLSGNGRDVMSVLEVCFRIYAGH